MESNWQQSGHVAGVVVSHAVPVLLPPTAQAQVPFCVTQSAPIERQSQVDPLPAGQPALAQQSEDVASDGHARPSPLDVASFAQAQSPPAVRHLAAEVVVVVPVGPDEDEEEQAVARSAAQVKSRCTKAMSCALAGSRSARQPLETSPFGRLVPPHPALTLRS
jgi:hypothetical protein